MATSKAPKTYGEFRIRVAKAIRAATRGLPFPDRPGLARLIFDADDTNYEGGEVHAALWRAWECWEDYVPMCRDAAAHEGHPPPDEDEVWAEEMPSAVHDAVIDAFCDVSNLAFDARQEVAKDLAVRTVKELFGRDLG